MELSRPTNERGHLTLLPKGGAELAMELNRIALSCTFILAACIPSFAQGWPPWADDVFGRPSWRYDEPPRWPEPYRNSNPENNRRSLSGGPVQDGGARPMITPQAPPVVAFPHDFPANSIVIDTGGRKLYYVLAEHRAYEYPISVGREGFDWTGMETVSRKQAWPDWYPPAEMRERDAKLPEKMTGGVRNPLGAMALYLGNSLYRIHGTNDAKSIGQAQSSGCFRMLNSAILAPRLCYRDRHDGYRRELLAKAARSQSCSSAPAGKSRPASPDADLFAGS